MATTTVTELRENGIYAIEALGRDERGDYAYFVAVSGDDGYALYTLDEWANGSAADWEIDADGRLCFQGNPWALTIADLSDTGLTAEGDVFRAQIDTRTIMGTDWPVIVEITRCAPGQTDEGVPVSWWVSQFCNGCYEGEGYGTTTFAEAVEETHV